MNACPACADKLFGVIANRTIEELHQDARDKGEGQQRFDVFDVEHGVSDTEWARAEPRTLAELVATVSMLLERNDQIGTTPSKG